MKRLILLACLLILSATGRAQIENGRVQSEQLNVISANAYVPFVSLNYERIFPYTEKMGFIGLVGLGLYDGPVSILAASVYTGGPIHRGELGATLIAWDLPLIHATYRYTHPNGFFGRTGLGYVAGEEGHPILSLGYSF
jgi:hypothetical protein